MNEHMERIASGNRSSGVAVRKLNRSLSLVVREGFDPDWYLQWKLLKLQGKRPVLVKDERCTLGYRVAHDEGASAPTAEEQDKALKELMDRAHGLPVQQLLLDAELRGQIASFQAELDLQQISGALTMEQRQQLASVLGVTIGAPANVKALHPVIDVQSSGSTDPSDSEAASED